MNPSVRILKDTYAAMERAATEAEFDRLALRFSLTLTAMSQSESDSFTYLLELRFRCGSWKRALELLPDP